MFFSFCFFTVDHDCESCTGVSEWPGWTSSPSLHFSNNPPLYPRCLLLFREPCWCNGWLGWPCCLWTGLQAAGPSPPPGLRAWGVASRETAETSGPTLSSSSLTTRISSWVRLARVLVFLELYALNWLLMDFGPIITQLLKQKTCFLPWFFLLLFLLLRWHNQFICLCGHLYQDVCGLSSRIKY